MEVWLNQTENLKKIEFDILNSVSTFEYIKINDLISIGPYPELLKILNEEDKSLYIGANIFFAKQLWSFANEIKIGDFIVVPVNENHKLVIGEVCGGYEYRISYPERFRHSIPVSWKGVF